MSLGTNEGDITAEEIIVQYGGDDDIPQDEGENLIRLEEDE